MTAEVAPWQPWNIAVDHLIHATADSPHWLVAAGIGLAKWPLYLALFLTVLQLLRQRDGEGGLRLVVAFAVALGVELLVSIVAYQPRPFVSGMGPALIHHAADNSMPSTHVTLTLIMAITLAERRWFAWMAVMVVLAVALAWARVFVGVHWPADMLGAVVSAAIATALALPIAAIAKRIAAWVWPGSARLLSPPRGWVQPVPQAARTPMRSHDGK